MNYNELLIYFRWHLNKKLIELRMTKKDNKDFEDIFESVELLKTNVKYLESKL